MHNEELTELLFTEEDRVQKAVADEIVRRADEMLPVLSEIAMDRVAWTADPPEFWAPVHATYLIGAIGGKDALVPLLAALRWSDAYDNDWVTEDLPSILGSLGNLSYKPLIAAVEERSAGWSARSIAMDALGSHALRSPDCEEEVMELLGRILRDRSEEPGARRSAAIVLLDFRRADLKRHLIAFAKEEEERKKRYPEYYVAFTPGSIAEELASPRAEMGIYLHEWMSFYSPEEMRKRQSRWADEAKRRRQDAAPSSQNSQPGVILGRNDLCPCGSGRPYKRCCWGKLH